MGLITPHRVSPEVCAVRLICYLEQSSLHYLSMIHHVIQLQMSLNSNLWGKFILSETSDTGE